MNALYLQQAASCQGISHYSMDFQLAEHAPQDEGLPQLTCQRKRRSVKQTWDATGVNILHISDTRLPFT